MKLATWIVASSVALSACVAPSVPSSFVLRAVRSVPLDEGWLFQPDPLGIGDEQAWQRPELDRGGWRTVEVPKAWDHFDPSMDGYEGVGWYALELPGEVLVGDAWQRLRFGRANHSAKVWIDGREAGGNLTGYLPFEVALTPFVEPGRPAWLVVRVENGVRYDWLPGTTTVEWVQYGGLLEPVELVTTACAYLEHVAIRAAPDGGIGRVNAHIEVTNTSPEPFDGHVSLATAGREVRGHVHVEPRSTASASVAIELADVRAWSPERPELYEAHVALHDSTGVMEVVSERFGVRSIAVQGREILLNGSPLRVRGVNRYDEFPGLGPVVDEATIRADLAAVKASGANVVRMHYPQAPVNLRIADELGLLVLEEVPLNWWRAAWHPPVPPEFENDGIIDLAEAALAGMIRRDGNHPCVFAWSMANECKTDDELGIGAMERLLRRSKELDPTRPATYVANRSIEKNRAFALADFVSINLYFGMWNGEIARDLSEIESRVHAPTHAALEQLARHFDKPVLLTEFGTIGVPGSGGDVRFSEDYQAAYVSAVWRAIEAVPEICGGIVWSWADYRHRRGFTNDFPAFFGPFGLVTLDRRPKKAHEALRVLWGAEPAAR